MPWIGKVVLIALAYLALGRLARFLNVPPDYATALFPPAGLAVGVLVTWGYRMWPGIFLGAILLNSTLPLEENFSLAAADVARSLVIASGALLQACAATWMVKHCVGLPNPLVDERSITMFLVLAGPVACVINASIGTAALALTGGLPPQAALRTWTLWWIGDSFGVLIVAPLLLAFFGEPAHAWRSRRFAVGLPLAFTFAAVVLVYHLGSEWEQQRIHNELREHMDVAANRISQHLNDALRLLHSVQHFYVATGNIEHRSFHSFISDSLRDHRTIDGLLWLRYVPAQQQSFFEQAQPAGEISPFRIWEINAQGNAQTAHTTRDRIVVEYAAPAQTMRHLIGLDVTSVSKVQAALDHSVRWNHVAAVGPVQLPAQTNWPAGLELYLAVAPPNQAGLPPSTPSGFVGTVINLEKIMADALNRSIAAHLTIELAFGTSPSLTLWQQQPKEKPRGWFPTERHRIDIAVGFDHCAVRLSATPSAAYLARAYGWQSWGVLFGGLVLTTIVGILLMMTTGRTVQVEAIVEERTAAMRHSESRLRAVLEKAGDGIVTLDALGHIDSANPAACALLGYHVSELIGKNFADLLDEKCRFRFLQRLAAPAGTGRARLTDVEARTKAGDLVPLELSVGEVHLRSRRFFTIILHDLTERRRIDQLKNAFVSTVSHELRTPLTSIRGSLGLLAGGVAGKMPQEASRLVEIAISNTERLGRLVDDILDVEKMESDKIRLDIQPRQITPLVEQAVAANHGYASNFQVSLRVHNNVGPDLMCELDADRFVQVLTNLISNAVKFSSIHGVVDIDVRATSHTLAVAVRDYGPGIPVEFQPHIFQKFAQADTTDSRRAHGTGLGLSISKALVERMNGTLRYETAAGEGTIFIMEFPLVTGQAPAG